MGIILIKTQEVLLLIFFPFLYKDELLYSILARYHKYSGNDNYKTTMNEIFSSKNVCATVLFPTHLNMLSQQLATSETYSSSYLIEYHTFLPYYAPFVPKKRHKEIKRMMSDIKGGYIYMKLGKVASTVKSPKYLSYCLKCIEEDQTKNGEAYWHRTHQVEGVQLCPKHHTWLIESEVPYSMRKNKQELITIDQSKIHKKIEHKHVDSKVFGHLKFIAEETYYLLNMGIEPLGLSNITSFYIKRLREKELTTMSARVRWLEVIPMFNQYYGEEFLNDLNCFIDKNKGDTWMHKLLRKPKVSCHPLRHILLLGFLGETVSSLVEHLKDNEYKPFGNGPWLCLNKAANHYLEPQINSHVISKDYKSLLPVGTFSCSCGFVYSRKGPDKTNEDSLKIGRIKNFGPVWDRKLLEVAELNISLREKARILGVDPMTVKKKIDPPEIEKIEDNKNEARDKYREQWKELLVEHDDKLITEIRSLNPNLYMKLHRNDKEWLKSNYPKNVQTISSQPANIKVDWSERDELIKREVQKKVLEILLKTKNNKLIRVTKHEIGRRIGKLALLNNNLDKMPKTKKVLTESVESTEQFQIRRIKYIVENMRKNNSKIKEWEVIRAAGLKTKYALQFKKIIQHEISNSQFEIK